MSKIIETEQEDNLYQLGFNHGQCKFGASIEHVDLSHSLRPGLLACVSKFSLKLSVDHPENKRQKLEELDLVDNYVKNNFSRKEYHIFHLASLTTAHLYVKLGNNIGESKTEIMASHNNTQRESLIKSILEIIGLHKDQVEEVFFILNAIQEMTQAPSAINNILYKLKSFDSKFSEDILEVIVNSGSVSPVRQRFSKFLGDCQQLVSDKQLPQPSCFISYCWGADDKLREELQARLKEFKRYLEKLGAKVYLDVQNLGTDINQFMGKIHECDFVFLIGTPALKARLEESGSNNLKTEFSHIERRLLSKPGCLLPLIFQAEGNFDSAFRQTMPEEFIRKHNILVRDCRQQGNEWTDPTVLTTYIDTFSGDGSESRGALGVIPVIYSMSDHQDTMRPYSALRQGMKDGLSLTALQYQRVTPIEMATNPNRLFSHSAERSAAVPPSREQQIQSEQSSKGYCSVM